MSEKTVPINLNCTIENKEEMIRLLQELEETIKKANALCQRLAEFNLVVDIQK